MLQKDIWWDNELRMRDTNSIMSVRNHVLISHGYIEIHLIL